MNDIENNLDYYKSIINEQNLSEYVKIINIYISQPEDKNLYIAVDYDIKDYDILSNIKSYFQSKCKEKDIRVKDYEKKYYYDDGVKILYCIKYIKNNNV